jgi:cytochrome c oxidase subunit 2
MKLDVTKLPLGELIVGFVLTVVVATFVLAFAFGPGTGIKGQEAEGSPGAGTPGAGGSDLVQQGQDLAQSFGCTACHSTTGEIIVGPSWQGIYGSTVTMSDGSQVKVDDAYIKESIQNPTAKVVQGFDPVMPSFSALTDADIEALTAYIKSLSGAAPAATATPEATASPEATPTP